MKTASIVRLPRGFQIAKIVSLQSNARSSRKMGAALFKGSILLALGWNTMRHSHPRSESPSLHAEHRCLIKRQHYDEKNLVMYVYRGLANGEPGCSKPCPNCVFLMKEAGVKSVHYVNKNGEQEKIKL